MEDDIAYEGLGDDNLTEETLIREGDDLMGICRQIYSHTPQTLEYAIDYETKPKGYTPNLERIIHMLRLYLELLLEFIGLSPNVASAFRRRSGVCTPVLSVPALAYTLWMRIKFLTTESIRNELETIALESERGKVSTETQTLVLSLTTCESCHLSQSVVKELVAKVELFCSTHEITESSVLSTRDQLRSKVHDVTNWEAMKEWCNALTTDIEQLTEITDKLLNNWKNERLKEKKRYEELENKLKSLEKRRSRTEINSENGNSQAVLTETNKLLMDLECKTEGIKELKSNVENFKTSSRHIQEECINLKNESRVEKNRVQQLEVQTGEKLNEVNAIISQYEIEMSILNKRIVDLENESGCQQKLLSEQLESLKIQESQINECKKNEFILQEKLKNNQDMINSYYLLQKDCKTLKTELDNKTKHEVMLKDKIVQLERRMNNLSEECEYLKDELQKYDPSFKYKDSE